MSTNATTWPRPTASATPTRPVRFSTLVIVELRKATDTRSGRAVLAVAIAACVAVLVWKVSHSSIEAAFENYSAGTATMVAFVMPVVGLLAMTSEWTQRTALTTFTLAPRRLPVLAAKCVASVVLAVAVTAVGLALAATATAIGGFAHGPADFDGWLGDARYAIAFVILQVIMGAAFGALVANTPVALSAFLLAPTVWTMLAAGALRPVAQWFDIFEAYGRLSSDRPLEEIGLTITAVSTWVILPAVAGLLRSLRREVR